MLIKNECLCLYSSACLSWFASKLQHGTSVTVVTDINNIRVYYLGLLNISPVTIVELGESKQINKDIVR